MPELPEVETVRRGLQKELPGARIQSISILRADSVAYPDLKSFIGHLKGKSFCSVERRGKYILMNLSDNTGMVAHLRMSGRLLILKKGAREPAHVRVRIQLNNGQKLVFDDTRVFGRLWLVEPGSSFEETVPALSKLGPEPTGALSAAHLEGCFKGKTQSVKTALLDQTIVAGIGNIYADESLFRAGIRPDRPAGDLKSSELKRLCAEIEKVIENAIALGGSTLRDYTSAEGVNGNYQQEALVYGRKGEPCRKCKKSIQRIKLSGRSTHFCPCCQR